jgi:hypothetical protein
MNRNRRRIVGSEESLLRRIVHGNSRLAISRKFHRACVLG